MTTPVGYLVGSLVLAEYTVVSCQQEEPLALPSALPASSETLSVWSGSDVMWGLSPGLRAIAGEERPRDVAALFFGLVPAQRKVRGSCQISVPFAVCTYSHWQVEHFPCTCVRVYPPRVLTSSAALFGF